MLHDLPLTDFIGSDGLMFLLELIEEKALPTDEVVEMIKRLHIPGYELARQHGKHAQMADVLALDAVPSYWSQTDVVALMQDRSVR